MTYDGVTPVLSDEKMRELGFTDNVDTRWYYCRRVDKRVTPPSTSPFKRTLAYTRSL